MSAPETQTVSAESHALVIDDVLHMSDFSEADGTIHRRDGSGADMSAWSLFSSGEPFDLGDWILSDPTASVTM